VSPTDPGNMFCSGSIDSSVKIWDVRARNPCTHTFTGHESDVNAVDFTPDGYCVGTGSEDASSILFDLRAHGPLNKFSDENAMLGIFSVCFSKTGRLMFAGYEEHMCYAWETISNEGCVRV
jgi:guanine nucleotide-binding protein G(I)/G(S)/G(T) subunit beta-1